MACSCKHSPELRRRHKSDEGLQQSRRRAADQVDTPKVGRAQEAAA
ncbi:hypothetical protein ABIE63_002219 [Limibacillus sp. MBR-115]|jgi:hypothetical protein